MGLDAVVYIHEDNLPLTVKSDVSFTDEQTGEVYFEDPGFVRRYPKSTFTAVQKNLGNIAMISALRNEIEKVIGNDSIISSKVLYSGSHSGDKIGVKDLGRLESEVGLVKERTSDTRSAALESFLDGLSELVEAAKKQGNPIVFV